MFEARNSSSLRRALLILAALFLALLLFPLRVRREHYPQTYIRERRETIAITRRDTLSAVSIHTQPRSRRTGSTTQINFDSLLKFDPAALAPDTVSISFVDSNGTWDMLASFRFAPREHNFAIPVTLRDSIIYIPPPPQSWSDALLTILSILGAAALGWLLRGVF